jgi:hypothetical protein
MNSNIGFDQKNASVVTKTVKQQRCKPKIPPVSTQNENEIITSEYINKVLDELDA